MVKGRQHRVGRLATRGWDANGACRRSSDLRRASPNTLRGFALRIVAGAAVLSVLAACSGDPGSGPVDVKWDRDTCTRCNMVLSDRQHAAQVRHAPGGGASGQVRRFDDFGCAVLWLDQQPWRDQAGVEFWVMDHRDGHWLDARTAAYVTGRLTPMQYGLGAQAEAAPGTLDYAQARAQVYEVERRFNVHGGNLEHPNDMPLPRMQGGDAATGQ